MFYVVVHQRRPLRKWKQARSYRESSLSELMSVFGAWIPFSRLNPKGRKPTLGSEITA